MSKFYTMKPNQPGKMVSIKAYRAWLAEKTRYVTSIISHYNHRQRTRAVNGYFLMFKEIV